MRSKRLVLVAGLSSLLFVSFLVVPTVHAAGEVAESVVCAKGDDLENVTESSIEDIVRDDHLTGMQKESEGQKNDVVGWMLGLVVVTAILVIALVLSRRTGKALEAPEDSTITDRGEKSA